MTSPHRRNMNILERIYEWSEDFEWNTGIPFPIVLGATSIAISTTAILITIIAD